MKTLHAYFLFVLSAAVLVIIRAVIVIEKSTPLSITNNYQARDKWKPRSFATAGFFG